MKKYDRLGSRLLGVPRTPEGCAKEILALRTSRWSFFRLVGHAHFGFFTRSDAPRESPHGSDAILPDGRAVVAGTVSGTTKTNPAPTYARQAGTR